jgi:RNA polymerase sigma factor (sigma-70 family)
MQNQNTYSLNTGDQQEDNNNLALTHGGLKKSLVPYDSLQRYLHEIGRYELLTREEESELARRYKEENDVEAGHRLVRANLRLVVKIAMGFFRLWSQKILDLIQEGNLGLVQALQKFDPYRGVKFSYYAAFWIRAYMLKFLMENWRLVKIEKARREAFDEKVKEYRAGLTGRRAFIFDQRIMREDPMTLEQIGKVYDISRERVRQIENHILNEMKKEIRKDLPEYAEENPEAAITDQG